MLAISALAPRTKKRLRNASRAAIFLDRPSYRIRLETCRNAGHPFRGVNVQKCETPRGSETCHMHTHVLA